jgi:hypothetical protein
MPVAFSAKLQPFFARDGILKSMLVRENQPKYAFSARVGILKCTRLNSSKVMQTKAATSSSPKSSGGVRGAARISAYGCASATPRRIELQFYYLTYIWRSQVLKKGKSPEHEMRERRDGRWTAKGTTSIGPRKARD